MSVWDVPRTDQLPAGCSPALLHGMGAPAGRGLMLPHHGDHFGMRYLPHPAVPCTQQDHPASVYGAAGHKSTSKVSLYFLTQVHFSAHKVRFTPKSLLIGPVLTSRPRPWFCGFKHFRPRDSSGHAAARARCGMALWQPCGKCICVSCGVRAHAQLPAVDLKSTPLTTRAN